MDEWKTTDTAPEDRAVMTKVDDAKGCRNQQVMVRDGSLWYAGEMYVYYTPTHWREMTEAERKQELQAIDAKEALASTEADHARRQVNGI